MTELRPYELDPEFDVVDFVESGVESDLTNCDREPIHRSGAIQPYGLMLAVAEDDLVVQWVSDNTVVHLGVEPSDVLGGPLHGALGPMPVEALRRAFGDHSASASGSDPVNIYLPGGAPYDLTWHRTGGLVIIELEPTDSAFAVSASSLYANVRQAMDALEATKGVQALCDVAAKVIQNLTGYDRVMVYRFHPDEHGEVVAEQRQGTQESFLGLHFPASDIPRQARKLYLLNHLRVIADVAYEPASLLCVPGGNDAALNLSSCELRSVSPFHLAYLTNMGVRATLTISLMRGTRLWGMLACHHDTPKRINAQMRAVCRVLGQMFSLQLAAHEHEESVADRGRLAAIEVQLVARMSGASSLADGLIEGYPSPLELTSADGMVARLDGQTVSVGSVPSKRGLEMLLTRLRADEVPSAMVSDKLPQGFDDLAPFAERVAGVLALPLSAVYQDFVIWFRDEAVHELKWAANPQKPTTQLTPRRSFATWVEEVRGRSEPWLASEIDAASTLASAIPELLLARAQDRLAHVALHDPLTGLPNRALLLDRTSHALAIQQRTGEYVAMLFIDLDHFKMVNDSFGHAAGDNLLRQASLRLCEATRASDTAARLGGDEFVVLCERTTSDQAQEISDRILQSFRRPFLIEDQEIVVTASIGAAVAEVYATPAELLRDADTAMYRAKQSGRNAVAPFGSEMRSVSLRLAEVETRLRPAFDGGELLLHYQPVQRVDGTLVGFEALARWPLSGRGMVPPAEFIPVAESTGLIDALTEWALDEGMGALARWRSARPDLALTLAVNITASQMTGDRLQHAIDRALARHRLPAQSLCLEITERALVTEDPICLSFLNRLRDQGVRLSIDDFGTGYSALAYLTKLPVHEVKIDRTFTAGLAVASNNVAVVASVVGLAHQLGLQVVAEGIETEDELVTVRRLGCDLVQGYLLGRPMPAGEIDRFLAKVLLDS